ncbi:MAG: hypothetical protein L3V56_02570 [Candidatus Magnetoovum sp. WYHC-5]|nr:hypothetical protein [Candidatus Magnetoovum sp. WYHC-5]
MNSLQDGDKVQRISEFLKASAIEPAQKEAKSIIDKANAQKSIIIEEARREAQKILESAQDKIKETHFAMESALRIAAKQAINSLKIEIEETLLNKTIAKPLVTALNDQQLLRDLLSEIAKSYIKNNFTGNIDILLSQQTKDKLKDFVQYEMAKGLKNTLNISHEIVPSGCKVFMKDNKVEIDITYEAVSELLFAYLKPEIRHYLFQDSGA